MPTKKYFQKTFTTKKRTPYFVDHRNVHCAVGYLMKESGHSDLVASIQKEHNFDYIENIKTHGVDSWAKNYGFTINELKWIQPGYPSEPDIEAVQNGTNGAIYDLKKDLLNNKIYFAGDFDSINSLPCLNVGYYQSGELNCFTGGIEGKINEIYTDPNNDLVYLLGRFEVDGLIYQIAKSNGAEWYFDSIPGRSNYEAFKIEETQVYNKKFYHIKNDVQTEIWSKNGAGNLTVLYSSKGLLQLDYDDQWEKTLFYGKFDSVFAHHPYSGNIIDTMIYQNFFISEYQTFNQYTIPGPLPDTINTLLKVGPNLLLGGSCSGSLNSSQVALVKYYNGQTIPIISQLNNDTMPSAVYDLEYFENSKVIVGGNYRTYPTSQGYGSNLCLYYPAFDFVEPIASFKGAVKSIAQMNYTFLFGGEFKESNIYTNMNHIGRLRTETLHQNEETIDHSEVQSYPSPFTNKISLTNVKENESFTLFNIHGQVVLIGKVENGIINDLDELGSGQYILKLNSKSLKLIKQ